MKRFLGFLLSIACMIGVMAGCAPTPTESSGTNTSGAATGDASNASTTRAYTDKAGRQIDIPVNPQKIVTISSTPEVVALGIKPVGAADNWSKSLDASQKSGIESVGSIGSLNLEKILELDPDLIITPEKVTDSEAWEALGKIAPTVVGPFFGDALENLRYVGEMLGRSDQAEAWITAYHSQIETTKEALSTVIEAGKTAMVLQLSSKAKSGVYLYPASTWPTIYDVLGLQLPDHADLKEMTVGAELSLEKLTEYDPDYIFFTSIDDATVADLRQEFTSSSIWPTLSAAKNSHAYTVGARLSSGDVLTLEWALGDVVRAVEEVTQ